MSNSKRTPEEIVQAEIGATDVSPTIKWLLIVAFVCTIVAVPLGHFLLGGEPMSCAGFSFADIDRDVEKLHISQSGIGYGVSVGWLYNDKTIENARKFENSIQEESWLLKSVGPTVERVMIGALGAGSRDVYCGRDGWLFFRPSIEYLAGPGFLEPEVMRKRAVQEAVKEKVQPDPVKAMIHFRNQLAKRGIELVVVPSPAKATIYPERFSSRYTQLSPPLQNPSYLQFVRRLQEQGIRVFDPTDVLFKAKGGADLFLKTDTHWTPAGSELVARELAAYLQRNKLLPDRGPVNYTKVAAHVENAGDLAKMLKGAEAYGYPKQRVSLQQVRQDDQPWAPSRDADLLFLGDSYANIFSLDGMGWGTGSGLVEELSFQLRRPVDSILMNDKGSFSTRQQLGNELRRGQDRLAGKKVLIYEFASRELALGDWKLIDLSLGKRSGAGSTATGTTSPASAAAAASQPGGLQVEGVLEEITRPPRPGSTAYKDAVIAMHLKQVTSGGKPFVRSQLVAFCWGMRDDKETSATRYKRGDRVTLKLRPWSEVERRYGSYQRIELSNEDTVFLDLFWLALPEDRDPLPPTAGKSRPGTVLAAVANKAGSDAVSQKVPPVPAVTPAAKIDAKALFHNRLLEITSTKEEARSITGVDGWLFSRQEINHLAKGRFWGEAAQGTSVATKPENRDPLAAILDFKQQLDKAGIDLIVVPVPAKAHLYPDKLVPSISEAQASTGPRLDPLHQEFIAVLQKEGIETLDLGQLFRQARKKDAPAVFLRTDTHWSPYGISLVAEALKKRIAPRPWFQALGKGQFVKKSEAISLKGDLLDATSGDSAETVAISKVRQIVDGAEGSPAPDRNSPIVLLGDSHTLIFHSGSDMYAKDSGLPEMLAYELGVRVDLVGVRGSGATPARVEVARRRDNMVGKKLVIWCFTVREFTESQSGWRKVQVIR